MTPTWIWGFVSKYGKWNKGTWLTLWIASLFMVPDLKCQMWKRKKEGKKEQEVFGRSYTSWKGKYKKKKKPFFCFPAHVSSISATDCAWSPAALLTGHGTVISKSTVLRGNNNFFFLKIAGLPSSLNFSAAFPTAWQVCNYHYWKLLFKEVQPAPEAVKGSEL